MGLSSLIPGYFIIARLALLVSGPNCSHTCAIGQLTILKPINTKFVQIKNLLSISGSELQRPIAQNVIRRVALEAVNAVQFGT